MSDTNKEDYLIEWVDIADDTRKYLAVSPETGHFWTDNPNEPLLVNGWDLPVKGTIDDTLKRIGEKKAAAIVAYRNQHGAFKSIKDLTNVKGLSQGIVDVNKAYLTLS